MKLSRALLSLPVFFLAGIAAEACSSSSNSTTPAADASTGDSSKQSSGSGSGTHPGSGSSTGPGSSTGSGSASSGTGSSCTPTLAPGFAPQTKTYGPTTSCTTAELTALLNDCFGTPSDAGAAACPSEVSSTCGKCVIEGDTSSHWAPILFVVSGQAEAEDPLTNVAGCVAAEDPAHGPACQQALDAITQCEIAACIPGCTLPTSSSSTAEATADSNALFGTFSSSGSLTANGCFENAESGPCASYVTAANTACASESNDAGTGALDKCNAIAEGASTLAGFQAYLASFCGGAPTGSGSGSGSSTGSSSGSGSSTGSSSGSGSNPGSSSGSGSG